MNPPPISKSDSDTLKTADSLLKKGDIVLNGYASPGINDLHIIVGTTSHRTGKYSSMPCYLTRMYFNGKLSTDTSLFGKKDNKLTKIGHYDFDKATEKEMLLAKESQALFNGEGKARG